MKSANAPDLFDDFEAPAAPPAPGGPFAGVAMENSIDRVLDYAIPSRMLSALRIGQRVKVPLGRKNRPAYGYVVSVHPTTQHPKIKDMLGIDDPRVLVTPTLMELARWMGKYYVTPLGSVIESIIPSAVKKKVGLGYAQIVRLAQPREAVQAMVEQIRAPKRRAILARLLQLPPDGAIEIVRLAGESGSTAPTVRKLARSGIITITPEADLPRLTAESENGNGGVSEKDLPLNEDQQIVFDELSPRIAAGGFSVNLLYGVTGSGKTEVYLQCIRQIVEQNRQAIVLVPEIALTPQTVKRFTARFRRVAVLHSGLGATARHRFWQRIAQGQADVIVGARSAVFAPVPKLGMIVVDEEHESSYKQDTAPRYHARDVAIKRAQIERVPILLGSATPALETFHRVKTSATASPSPLGGEGRGEGEAHKDEGGRMKDKSKSENPIHPSSFILPPYAPNPLPQGERGPGYFLLKLPRRVRGLALPHVELVDLKVVNRYRRGVHLLSPRLEFLLKTTIDGGHQAILLLNRRGYSNFVHCSSCNHVMQCKYCDTTMTYHRSAAAQAHGATLAEGVHTGQLHCHYCLAVNPLPEKCPNCGKKLSLFGLGTQRVEEELARKFPELTFARVDSDSMRSSKDYEQALGKFSRGEIQVLLGTQMIAKGLDYPNVTLVGVINGDTALALPDFRAAERTFQLITQVAGRAGRGDSSGRVVLQTFLPEDPTIRFALKQDYDGFAKNELSSRKEVGLPPFARMVRIVIRDQEQARVHQRSEELAALFAQALAGETEVMLKGPMPCAINRIAGYFRNQIILLSPRAAALQRILGAVREKGGLAKGDRIAVDVDPVSLL